MKILHTSDWHLGQSLYGRKRYDEFQGLLDWLRQVILNEGVEALLISGDIFDSGLPSNHAQALYYRFLRDVSAGPCRHIVIIAGNHDSPTFLDAPRTLLHSMGVHVIGSALSPEEEVLLLRNESGTPELIVCAVPFLRDRDLFKAAPGDTTEERDQLLAEGLREHYRRCAAQADSLRNGIVQNGAELSAPSPTSQSSPASASPSPSTALSSPDIPVIAMGHLFTSGGLTLDGDGVRDLRIGSLGQIDADVFPATFDYVALGHLHVPQRVRHDERIRYCGSPLPMGFGEARQQKQVCLVETEGRNVTVRAIYVPVFQKLEQIHGDRDAIEARLDELEAQKDSVWVEIRYTGTGLASDLRDRLMQKELNFVSILSVRRERIAEACLTVEQDVETLEDMKADDVFERRLADLKESGKADEPHLDELRRTYREAVRSFQQIVEGEELCAS